MKIREAARATFNLHWAGSKNEEECWRLSELWCAILGDADVKLFTGATIAKACEQFKNASCSNGTLNRRLAALSKILSTAMDLGALESMPTIRRFKEAPHRERYLTQAEEKRLLSAAVCPTLNRAIIILLDTGARVGELFKARDTDVFYTRDSTGHCSLKRSWHISESKSGKPRTIPFTTRAMIAWNEQCEEYHPLPFGQACTRSKLSHLWEDLRESVCLEEVRLHDLRHTFASRLVQRGTSIYTVQHLLGHQSVVTTMRYAHLNVEQFTGAIDLLEPEEQE